jgi:hypothetical protein
VQPLSQPQPLQRSPTSIGPASSAVKMPEMRKTNSSSDVQPQGAHSCPACQRPFNTKELLAQHLRAGCSGSGAAGANAGSGAAGANAGGGRGSPASAVASPTGGARGPTRMGAAAGAAPVANSAPSPSPAAAGAVKVAKYVKGLPIRGWLQKRNNKGMLKTWKLHWFCQMGSLLNYYKSDVETDQVLGSIELTEVLRCERQSDEKGVAMLALSMSNGGEVHLLRAEHDDPDGYVYWIDAFGAVVADNQSKASLKTPPLATSPQLSNTNAAYLRGAMDEIDMSLDLTPRSAEPSPRKDSSPRKPLPVFAPLVVEPSPLVTPSKAATAPRGGLPSALSFGDVSGIDDEDSDEKVQWAQQQRGSLAFEGEVEEDIAPRARLKPTMKVLPAGRPGDDSDSDEVRIMGRRSNNAAGGFDSEEEEPRNSAAPVDDMDDEDPFGQETRKKVPQRRDSLVDAADDDDDDWQNEGSTAAIPIPAGNRRGVMQGAAPRKPIPASPPAGFSGFR